MEALVISMAIVAGLAGTWVIAKFAMWLVDQGVWVPMATLLTYIVIVVFSAVLIVATFIGDPNHTLSELPFWPDGWLRGR